MVKESTKKKVTELTERYPKLARLEEKLTAAVEIICDAYKGGRKVLACGNGGSAADAEHIVGELMKSFVLPRPLTEEMKEKITAASVGFASAQEHILENLEMPLTALSLTSGVALPTAFANDKEPDLAFAQQVLGLGRAGDVLLAISTSGNSSNVCYAAIMAKALSVKVIALTGKSGGRLSALADLTLAAPDDETYRIQELHLPIYHMLCIAVENEIFGE